jgi:hypothetical protein
MSLFSKLFGGKDDEGQEEETEIEDNSWKDGTPDEVMEHTDALVDEMGTDELLDVLTDAQPRKKWWE